MNKNNNRNYGYRLRMTKEEFEMLEKISEEENMSKADVLRLALKHFMIDEHLQYLLPKVEVECINDFGAQSYLKVGKRYWVGEEVFHLRDKDKDTSYYVPVYSHESDKCTSTIGYFDIDRFKKVSDLT